MIEDTSSEEAKQMQNLITSMGEILIDFLPIKESGQTVGFLTHPGGAPMNVAIGVARLGQPAAFASKVSSDMFGRYLRDFVTSQGVDPRFMLDSTAQSTLAFVTMVGSEPEYNFYTTGTADTLLTIDELPAALFEETRILHYGSISLLRGTTVQAVLATVERLKGRALLSCDPNLRPGLIEDETSYRATLNQAMALADIIKISAADLDWLMPGRSVEAAAAELLSLGAALVVVTRGGEGVYALRAEAEGPRVLEVPAFNVRVVDTVGAGDSFSGGLLASLSDRGIVTRAALQTMALDELAFCLKFATAVSALTCTRAGADPPDHPTVARFLAEHTGL
ncbi:MAG: carbohydrate kinase [Chloroflexi bacterium]|nr:carbohydrate kinase [Chloroflexota bacterium]